MLSLILNETLEGVDIIQKYPHFYQRLLADDNLHELFIDSLELLEAEKSNNLLPLPSPASQDLRFLPHTPILPSVQQLSPQKWQFEWQQTIAQLRYTFGLEPTTVATRESSALFEQNWHSVIRSNAYFMGKSYAILLEMSPDVEIEGDMQFCLLVANITPESGEMPACRATLRWGPYQETVTIPSNGRVCFPSLSLPTVMNETEDNFIADLQFVLEI